jgi:hypothetical protein
LAQRVAPAYFTPSSHRHARDREEFERFMDEHRNQQGTLLLISP